MKLIDKRIGLVRLNFLNKIFLFKYTTYNMALPQYSQQETFYKFIFLLFNEKSQLNMSEGIEVSLTQSVLKFYLH